MRPWPDRTEYVLDCTACHTHSFYERARADAAMERLRLAEIALKNIRDKERFDADGIWYRMPSGEEMSEHAAEALEAIGEVP